MLWPQPADYTTVPFSSIGSRLGLNYSFGMPNGRFGWAWAGTFCNHYHTSIISPFVRLEGQGSPRLACTPGVCVQTGENAKASFYFVGQDALQTILEAPGGTRCHFGSPRLRLIDPHTAICPTPNGWHIALHAPATPITAGHSGVTVTTAHAQEPIGCGMADNADEAVERARSAARFNLGDARTAAEAPWREAFAGVPQPPTENAAWRRVYIEGWWTLFNNVVAPHGRVTRRGIYPDRIYHNAVWLWDACFHAVAMRHADPQLAREQLLILLDNQQPSGLVPDVTRDDKVYDDHTKPPLIAWAAWKIHEVEPRRDFLDEIYPKLAKLDEWWSTARDVNRNGLPGYEHPFSAGTDDSPAFDGLDTSSPAAELEAPDLAAYLHLQRTTLAQMAEVLGRPADAQAWRGKTVQIAQAAAVLHDPQDDFFYARRDGARVNVRIPHYLLAARLLPPDAARRLLNRWLVEDRRFEQRYLLASVAFDEPSYDPLRWRGGIWININLLVAETALRAGLPEVAGHIARRTLDLVAATPGIWEHYDCVTGEPGGPATFGWTAAVCIDFLLSGTAAR